MTVKDIVKAALEAMGADGLFRKSTDVRVKDCSCSLHDRGFLVCVDTCPKGDCVPAKLAHKTVDIYVPMEEMK